MSFLIVDLVAYPENVNKIQIKKIYTKLLILYVVDSRVKFLVSVQTTIRLVVELFERP